MNMTYMSKKEEVGYYIWVISSYTVSILYLNFMYVDIMSSLIGARSKVITKTAYWKIFDITYECKESSFIEEKFSGYNTEWIRYGYFELIKPMYIHRTQNFIGIKKVDFRHLPYKNSAPQIIFGNLPCKWNLLFAKGCQICML